MAQKKHNFTKTEIMAGLMVLTSLAVLCGFIAVVSGMRPAKEVKTFHARFTNTNGLNVNADVRFGGMAVGKVVNITPDPEDQTQMLVEVAVDPNTPVNKYSEATVEQVSLTSARHLEITTGLGDAPQLEDGANITAISKGYGLLELPDTDGIRYRVENLLDDVIAFLGVKDALEREKKGEEEFAQITHIAADVRKTINEGNGLVTDVRGVLAEQRPHIGVVVERVKEIEGSVQSLVDELDGILKENRAPIHSTIHSADSTLKDVREMTAQIGAVVDKVTSQLDSLVGSLQSTLDNADQLSGNARDLLETNQPAIEDIVLDLRETVRYLKTFSRTMAEQPQSVIRGKAPEGRRD